MQRRFRLALDILALTLLAGGLVATLTLVTFDPADPPGATVHPQNATPSNLIGSPGASVARFLVDTLGVAVYAALLSWVILVLTLLLEGRRGVWCWRLLGWVIMVPGVALGADVLGLEFHGSPMIGPGGLIGAALHEFLAAQFTPVGVVLVLVACGVGGLGLAGDVLWPILFRWMGRRWNLYRQRQALRRGGAGASAADAADAERAVDDYIGGDSSEACGGSQGEPDAAQGRAQTAAGASSGADSRSDSQ